jgi:hypothetical protein
MNVPKEPSASIFRSEVLNRVINRKTTSQIFIAVGTSYSLQNHLYHRHRGVPQDSPNKKFYKLGDGPQRISSFMVNYPKQL